MTFNQFTKQSVIQDTPVGDLAKDILRDSDFPKTKSDTEIYSYLKSKTASDPIVKEALDAFWSEYLDTKQ